VPPQALSLCQFLYAKVEDAVRAGRYGMGVTDESKMYAKGLNSGADLNFKLQSARPFAGLEALIEEHFLIVSKKYRQWVDDHCRDHGRFACLILPSVWQCHFVLGRRGPQHSYTVSWTVAGQAMYPLGIYPG
jgi:hypothetical protein